jgi:hypothetical protein
LPRVIPTPASVVVLAGDDRGMCRSDDVRTILTLALAARGLIDVVDGLARPWDRLVVTLLLALLTLGFLAGARRSGDRRLSWLLSAAIAAGLSIAAFYDLMATAAPATCFMVLVTLALLVARGARGRARR